MKKLLFIACAFTTVAHAQVIDRSKRPKAAPAPVLNYKDPAVTKLPNGITVIVVEDHKLPKVNATMQIDVGPIVEGDKAGLMQLLGSMMGEGTKNLPKEQFDEAVESLGSSVYFSSNGGGATALTRYFDKTFGYFADGIKNPAFPQASFDKVKKQAITGFKSNEKNAETIATRVFSALAYGKKTAFGEFETEQTLSSITLADIQAAYKNYITPSRCYITFVGDITPIAANALVKKYFSTWAGRKLPEPTGTDVKNVEKTEINFVDLPSAVQGQMAVGNVVNNQMSNPDYHALLMANQILGGGADSKLFMNLREKHGFTYGSYSRVGSGRFQSLFKASAAVRTDKVDSAVNELFKEILNMRDGKVTDEELSIAKAKYNGNFAMGLENPARSAEFAYNIMVNNLPKDFYKLYLQKINAVNIADIKRVSNTYFSEAASRIVIVGNAKQILPKLPRLGFGIKMYDKFAEPVVEAAANTNVKTTNTTTDAISAFGVIEAYLTAIGGKDAAKAVNTLAMEYTVELQGRKFVGVTKRANPTKSYTDLKMGAMVVMQSVFNGTTGYQKQGPQKMDMGPDEIKEQLDEPGCIPHINYNGAGIKTEYIGAGKIGDEATYRLKATFTSGRVSVQEFGQKSGLLLKEETTANQGGQSTDVTIEYSNYKKVGNLLLPFKVTRNFGGLEITADVTSYKINEGVTDADFK
jgi:zinc protease